MKDKRQIVLGIIADRFDLTVTSINEEHTLEGDIQADSLDRIELVMELEKEFSMIVSDEDHEKYFGAENTVADVFEYVLNI